MFSPFGKIPGQWISHSQLVFNRGFAIEEAFGKVQRPTFRWIPQVKDPKIPAVLKQDYKGLGKQGQIVTVSRGLLRHHLAPKNIAVVGTWENIDEFAKKHQNTIMTSDGVSISLGQERMTGHPFDFLHNMRMTFSRSADVTASDKLSVAVTKADILKYLSEEQSIDLLPSNITFPPPPDSLDNQQISILNPNPSEYLDTAGTHMVDITMHWKNGPIQYKLIVEIVSEEELRRKEERQSELASKQYKKPVFSIKNSTTNKQQDATNKDDNAHVEDTMSAEDLLKRASFVENFAGQNGFETATIKDISVKASSKVEKKVKSNVSKDTNKDQRTSPV